jgi:2Fe-2S ferredoxin
VPVDVVFECPDAPPCAGEARPGDRVVDLCDGFGAEVPFSCRSASCGTCRIAVVEGAALLEPPGPDEAELLEIFGDDPEHYRLACQARLRGGAEGRLRLRVMPLDE